MIEKRKRLTTAYEKFRSHRETECAEQFEITLNEWITYFSTVATAVAKPTFKAKRIRRIDTNEPWSILNIRCLTTEQFRQEQMAPINARRGAERAARKAKPRRKTTEPKALKSATVRVPNARKPDEDGTKYEVITVAEWKAQLGRKAA